MYKKYVVTFSALVASSMLYSTSLSVPQAGRSPRASHSEVGPLEVPLDAFDFLYRDLGVALISLLEVGKATEAALVADPFAWYETQVGQWEDKVREIAARYEGETNRAVRGLCRWAEGQFAAYGNILSFLMICQHCYEFSPRQQELFSFLIYGFLDGFDVQRKWYCEHRHPEKPATFGEDECGRVECMIATLTKAERKKFRRLMADCFSATAFTRLGRLLADMYWSMSAGKTDGEVEKVADHIDAGYEVIGALQEADVFPESSQPLYSLDKEFERVVHVHERAAEAEDFAVEIRAGDVCAMGFVVQELKPHPKLGREQRLSSGGRGCLLGHIKQLPLNIDGLEPECEGVGGGRGSATTVLLPSPSQCSGIM